MTLLWGAAVRPKQGQTVSGDVYVLEHYGEGQVLAAVIDGLGGGTQAYHAAQLAADTLRRMPDYPLPDLIRTAHTALYGSRGAVIGILRLDTTVHKAWYIGVGNIGIHAFSTQQIKPISKNGILGARLPALLELHYTYNPGDTFVLYSDGISTRWSLDSKLDLRTSPQDLADTLLGSFGKTIDDATVLVVRT
jgi:negative regulator of sigma-B (phosphoserine phosphatase)